MPLHRTLRFGTFLLMVLAFGPAHGEYVGGLNPAGDNFLALRAGPGSSFRMIRSMAPDTLLTVLQRKGKWLLVRMEDGTKGWAFGDYVLDGKPADADLGDVSEDEPQANTTELAGQSGSANAQVRSDVGSAEEWATYSNGRFGTSIDYAPKLFRMEPPPENDDGRRFVSLEGSARFMVFGAHNVFGSTLPELIGQDLAAGQDETVSYRRSGKDWFVHSGIRGRDFFLRKVVLGEGGEIIHTFEISYPKADKARFDPVASRMAASLNAPGAGGRPPPKAESDAETVKQHSFGGFTLSAPMDWQASAEGDTLVLKAPDGKRSLMVWWWFPDEPLLGYSDIISHSKVRVAGKPALRIYSKTGEIETISVTLDEARADKRRLHFLFEATGGIGLGDDEPALDRILESLSFADSPDDQKAAVPAAGETPLDAVERPADSPELADPADTLDEEEVRRAWIAGMSVEIPSGWMVRNDEDDGVVMTRPDQGAEIAVSFWPADRPMPSQEVESLEYATVLGRPATILHLLQGSRRGTQIFFDDPRSDGARLTLSYLAIGEEIADGLPLFELVLASLDDTMPPPPGTPVPAMTASAQVDPFDDIDLRELEVDPR